MQTHIWCQKYQIDLNLDGALQYMQSQMESTPWVSNESHTVLDKNSRYWDWYTRDIKNSDIIEILNFLEKRHKLPVNTDKTRIALWEYGEGDTLPPHVDANISLSSAIIVSLVGRFETYLYDQKNKDQILDRVEYGPGDYIILNNTVYPHGGRPLEKYRLALVAFVDPSYDMTEFWS